MKKMLVLFLILFTTVLADSDEDKYIDLLPDEEKQEFLEKVARRILKDVQSQEEITDAQSGEVNDDQLKQHTEYVKAVLKEEQENTRRSKGYGNETEEKPLSEEKDLVVKPLASLKVSLFNERQDLTLRTEQGDAESNKDSTNNITAEIVMDDAPIIKRSVQDDNTNNSSESDETTYETLNRVSQTNIASEEINDVQAVKKKLNNSKSNVQALSETDSEAIESKSEEDEENRVKPVEENSSNLNEKGALNVSVKGIHEGSRRLIDEDSMPTVNTTVNNTAIAAEVIKSNENNSAEYNNVSNADEGLTTSSNPFKGTSAKGNTEDTFTIDPLVESTIEITTNKTTENTETETETTSVPETTESIVDTTMNIPEITNVSKILTTEAETESTTFMAPEETTESTLSLVATTEKKIDVEDFTSTPTISSIVETDNLKPKKSIKPKKKTTNTTKFPQTVTVATPETEESIEVTTRKTIDHKIVVHRPSEYIVGPKAKKNAETDNNNGLNKNFIDLGKVYFNNNKEVKVGKEYHVFEIPADSSPFINEKEDVVEQPYYVPIYNYSPNNAYFNPKNRLGPNPGDSDSENIFNNDDDLNKFDRTESLNVKMEYDSTYDSKRKKFGSKQKISQSINRQPLQNKQPLEAERQINAEDYLDSDYYYGRVRNVLLRKANEDLNTFPNSDETDHPAHSIQEGSLKDHVRAVRNILFQQKSFGLLEKDKYGESMEQVLRIGSKSNVKEALRKGSENDFKATNDIKNGKNDENHISIDYYFGSEKPTVLTDLNQDGPTNTHIQKVGYLKKQNDTKALYIMDDVFKANVEKYIQENSITPVTPRPDQTAKAMVLGKRDALIAYLRMEERQNKARNVSIKINKRAVETKSAAPNQNDIPMYPNARPSKKVSDLKLNVRRNDVVKVSVYLQVLKDMITLDNRALVEYDWLGTTVDIQASLQKLFELTSLVATEEDVHPADMEILKYVLFLHKLSSEIIEANDFGAQLRNKLDVARNKRKKKKTREQKEKGLINKVWLYLRKELPEVNEFGALKSLNSFLINLEDGLYDLHVAIKNIAKITKYKNQHWYQNLKDLYVETDETHLLEVLLHITALRLFSLIEESAKNGLEDDYVEYMKQNRKHCKRTLEEMIFVMEVLEEYNKFVEL